MKMISSKTAGFGDLSTTSAALSVELRVGHALTLIAYAQAIHPFKRLLKMH